MLEAQPRISACEKLAYGLGDSAANFVFQTQITFLMFFYTDVFGLAAGTAGTIVLVSRLFDAFIDPVIGAIADRTTTRWGRYRPWILWTALPLALALVLCYTTPPLGPTGRLYWAIVTYNILMITYAANNIPYCALSGVMTVDSLERTSLSSWRFVCAMATAFVVNTFTSSLVTRLGGGNPSTGYPLTMALWATIAVVFFIVTFTFTKERMRADPIRRSSVRQDLADLLRSRPWMTLFLVAVLIHVQLAMRSGAMLYYFSHYRQSNNVLAWIDNFGLFSGVGLVFTMVGVALAKPLASRFGKRTVFRGCLLLSALLMASFAIVPPDSFYLLLVLQILLQLTFGPTIPILWSMMADVADHLEWFTGHRLTALTFASIIFGLKLGLGVGSWLNGALLTQFSYSPTQPLSTASEFGIVALVSIFPAATLVLAFAGLLAYRLDDKLLAQIESSLRSRAVGVDVSA